MDAQVVQQDPADQTMADVKSHTCTPDPQRNFKSFRQVQQEQRAKRANRTKPPPWIARKLAVFIVIGLIIFATYVYVGRACVPLIRQDPGAVGGGRAVGISFMAIYWVLWVMCVWTYGKIITTPPGFARDYVKPSPPPNAETVAGPRYESQASGPRQWDAHSATNTSIDPYQYDLEHAERHDVQAPDLGSLDTHEPVSRTTSRTGVANEPRVQPQPTNADQEKTQPKSETSVTVEAHHDQSDVAPSPSQPGYPPPSSATAAHDPADEVTELDVFPSIGSTHAKTKMSRETDATAVQSSTLGSNTRQLPPFRGFGELKPKPPPPPTDLPPLANTRQPPRHAMLAEDYRYCSREGFVKPIRAHHCRVCATCVLNFDHHCPWIGHCVGARNRKFFVNFVYWGFVYCAWICFTLIALNAQASHVNKDVDIPQLVVIVLTGLFALFTLGLGVTHTYLIMLNLTTVEDYGIKSMQERESYTLSQMFPWWNLKAKKRTRRAWDEEWGGLKTEGNIWWLGSWRTNWEQVMGKNPWGWIFPIGHSEADGLSYPINPRFTPDGRWRRRTEWPAELR